MLSGRGLCDELLTRPEESYRLWCVVVCDLGNLKNEEAIARDWAASAIETIMLLVHAVYLEFQHPNCCWLITYGLSRCWLISYGLSK